MLKVANSVINASQIKTPITLAGDVTLSTGNLIPGTAAKGVNFTANTPAAGMTSQLLNWYEEGTWSPGVAATIGAIISYTSSATYTRVGRQVTNVIRVDVTNNGTGAGAISITNFPFSSSSSKGNNGACREDSVVGFGIVASGNTAASTFLTKYDGTYPVGTGYGFTITIVQNT